MSNYTNYILNLEGIKPSLEHLLVIPTTIGEVDIELEFTVYGNYYPMTFNHPAEYPELGDIEILSATCYTTDMNGFYTGNSFKLTEKQFKYLWVFLEKEANRLESKCWDSIDTKDNF